MERFIKPGRMGKGEWGKMGLVQLRINTMQNYTIVRFDGDVPMAEITLTPKEMRQLAMLMKEEGF